MSVAAGRTGTPDGGTARGTARRPAPPVLPRRRSRQRDEPSAENDVRELQEAFNMFDKNQDGIICREDLQACLTMLGHPEPSDHIIDRIIRNAGNRNGEIHRDSFILWMRRTNNGEDGVLRHAFNVMDRDGDGFLCMDDLRDGMNLLGENLSEKMLEIMFSEADRNKDGRVSYDDFVCVLKK